MRVLAVRPIVCVTLRAIRERKRLIAPIEERVAELETDVSDSENRVLEAIADLKAELKNNLGAGRRLSVYLLRLRLLWHAELKYVGSSHCLTCPIF